VFDLDLFLVKRAVFECFADLVVFGVMSGNSTCFSYPCFAVFHPKFL